MAEEQEEQESKSMSVWANVLKPLMFLLIFTILSWFIIAALREGLRRASGLSHGSSNEDMIQALLEHFENKNKKIVKEGPVKIENINWEVIGLGGLTKQMETIVQRVFLTRLMDKDLYEKSGMSHTKGVVLYGPPGCGKTRMARVLGEIIGGHEITVINGPEIFDPFVGRSEEKVRRLFEPAKRNPDKLYILIFDEFDAIAGTRNHGSSSGGVDSRVVNQLLTEIDGFVQQDNIVCFALTNRLDMIDPALLRPGRFEVHIEVPLPDQEGRGQILLIHSRQLRESNMIDSKMNWDVLAELTEGYSGADLEALIRLAFSSKIHKVVDNENIVQSISHVKTSDIFLTNDDFEEAIRSFKKTKYCNDNKKMNRSDFDRLLDMAQTHIKPKSSDNK
jgi:vesicle-fusing ATPase